MMGANITEQKAFERRRRLSEILQTLKDAKKDKKEINRTEFIFQICIKYDCQQRKASEYLKIAEYMLKHGNKI